MEILEKELETYRANFKALLGGARGQYVLIKDSTIVDTFASIDDALKRGYEEFGAEPFLVHQVNEIEEAEYFTSFQIGC